MNSAEAHCRAAVHDHLTIAKQLAERAVSRADLVGDAAARESLVALTEALAELRRAVITLAMTANYSNPNPTLMSSSQRSR